MLLWHVLNLQESAGATNRRLVDLDSFAAYTIHIYIYTCRHTDESSTWLSGVVRGRASI